MLFFHIFKKCHIVQALKWEIEQIGFKKRFISGKENTYVFTLLFFKAAFLGAARLHWSTGYICRLGPILFQVEGKFEANLASQFLDAKTYGL